MMLPRTHTWLYLLPADGGFECRSGPDWLRQPLSESRSAGGRRVVVEFERTPKDLTAGAFVGINCRGIGDQVLKSAGFSHVRRYAVLPGWENPRWFIPLSSPAVSSAGFNLYTPARTLARLKRAAARAAVHTRLPFWYRDQVLIAQRQPAPLENAMSRLFPQSNISIALSSGAPEGARNRKASAAVIDGSGTLLAFLKLAGSDLSRSLLEHEAEILRSLSGQEGFESIAPRLLSAEEVDGVYVTAQAPLPGSPAPTSIASMHREFLDRLTPGTPAAPADTQLVRSLPGRIASLPRPQPQLSAALDGAWAVLESQRLRTGAVHGDFAPWNLRRHSGRIAAFDWEYASLNGPAGLDEIHYRLQVGYLLDNWTIQRAMEELSQPMVLGRYLSRPDAAARRALVVLYLVDVLTRLYTEGYDQTNDMVEWNLRLLLCLGFAAPREAVLA